MAVTNEQVFNWLQANPTATDAQIAQAAAAAGVSAAQLSAVTGVPVAQVEARVAAAAPTVQLPPAVASAAPAPTLFSAPESAPASTPEPASAAPVANTWNYDDYVKALKTGGNLGEQVQKLATQNPELASRAANLFGEITAQQQAGSDQFWAKGNTASTQAAAADFALRLAENGIGSLSQIGQLTIPSDGESPEQQITIDKTTGQPLPRPELLGRGQRGLDIDYNLAFTENGQVIPYTSNRQSSWMNFREDTLKPAAVFVGSILAGQALGGAFGGAGAATDASFLAADAAQLAAQGLSESAIAQVLSAPGYASTAAANLAASMAVNGLDVGMMTQQLNALSTNTGLMSQTGSSADFLAADALQLRGQLGNNFAAIEQNLIASGVDPLIAADVSQQLAFNPNLTQTDLATNLANSFGNNIYDVNMAQTYPTSVLPGAGGLLSNLPAATVPASTTTPVSLTPTTPPRTTTTPTTGLPPVTPGVIGNLVKAGAGLLTTGAVATAAGSGANVPLQAPTQGVPTNDANYYNQLQQYYNAYLPQTPRDVVTPLQQWYNSSYGA